MKSTACEVVPAYRRTHIALAYLVAVTLPSFELPETAVTCAFVIFVSSAYTSVKLSTS